jgi:hypothetical protein
LAEPRLDDKEHDCHDPGDRNPLIARRRYTVDRAKE